MGRILIAAAWMLVVNLAALAQQPKPEASERTRTFPSYKCRYTLPGPGWSWSKDPTDAKSLCAAVNDRGVVVSVGVMQLPRPMPLNQEFINGYENGFYTVGVGKLNRRGGRYTSFLGLPAYQSEATHADGRTTAARITLANGYGYILVVIGGKEPVEQHPDFEKMMAGFAFTEPPVVVVATETAADKMYQVVGGGIFLLLIAFLLLRFRRGSRPRPRPTRAPEVWRDEEEVLPEVLPAATAAFAGHTGVTSARPGTPPAARLVTPPSSRVRVEYPKGTGSCRHCGHRPIAFDALECPQCAGGNPNPGIVARWAGRGTIIGILVGGGGGALSGYLNASPGNEIAYAFAGLMVGTLAGILVGLVGGFVTGIAARIVGYR